MNFRHMSSLRSRTRERLSDFPVKTLKSKESRCAAVSIVMVKHSETDDASVLLTLRPDHMNRHGGQYALPGGRVDEGETPEQAALRELSEELGLLLTEDHILGRLDDYPTRSGFSITPFVLWVDDPVHLTPDANEVAEVHQIPFLELDSPDIPILTRTDESDHPVLSAYLPTLGHEVYAPTAAMLYQFREVALRGENTRVAHYDQPGFAWE